jgi:hypothetical protein
MSKNIPDVLAAYKDMAIQSMTEYLNFVPEDGSEFDAGYRRKDIEACEALLTKFLNDIAMKKDTGDAYILMSAEELVLKLNDLNESCDGSLIETDQREYICEMIIKAASLCGFLRNGVDITDKWRAW